MFSGPPRPSIEGDRKNVFKRVKLVGGWSELRSGCESLITNYPPNNFYELFLASHRMRVSEFPNNGLGGCYFTNNRVPLPPALATLQPQRIEFQVISNAPTVVRVKFFGTGKTDWTPYYGLWVVIGTTSPDFTPAITNGPWRVITKVSDSIFEVHD
jgi:hypothetical protein